MPLPRSNTRGAGIRSLQDLEARCKPEGECLRWLGAVSKDQMPMIWIPTVGPRGLQVAFHLCTTGQPRLPGRLAYIPRCGNLWCCDFSHRREGTRSELASLINSRMTEGRRAAYQKRAEEYAARRPPKPVKEPKPPKVKAEPKPKPKAPKAPKPAKPQKSPRLVALDQPVRSAVGQQHRGVSPSIYRHAGSSARPVPMDRPEPTEPRITERTRVTIAPTCADYRYTVRELPAGYVSALNPNEARPWAQAAAQGRGA